jgi:Transglutaminase-like superfamily
VESPGARSQKNAMSRMNMLRRRQVLVSAFALATTSPMVRAGSVFRVRCERPDPSGEERRRLRMSVSLHNPSGNELVDVGFWCFVPMTSPDQALAQLTTSVPYLLREDALGQQVFSTRIDRLAPYGSRSLPLALTVVKTAGSCPVSGEMTPWLGPEQFIESDAAEIVLLARKMLRGNDVETVRATYQWIMNELQYEGYVAQDRGALYAARTRTGDCTEYAALLVAMLRANGIPARLLGGFVVDQDALLRSVDYHNWAEVFVDARWHIVDPQKGRWMPTSLNYVPFEIYREHHSNEMEGAHRFRVDANIQVAF